MSPASRRLPLWLALGLLLAAAIAGGVHSVEQTRLLARFERDVDDKVTALQRELALHFEVLYMLRGLYDASSFVSRAEFARISRDVLARHHTIQALKWVPRVPAAERAEWAQKARAEFPDFQFSELGHTDTLQVAGEADVYHPVYYLEPLAGNEIALGFDLGSDPVLRTALQLARDTDQLTASGPVRLVQARDGAQGIVVTVPVYRGVPTTLEARQRNLYGFVTGVYRVDRLFEHALHRTAATDLHLRLVDLTEGAAVVLYEVQGNPEQSLHGMSYSRELAGVGGRTWRVEARPLPRYLAGQASYLPWAVFGLLSVVVLSSGFLMRLLQRQHEEVQRQVELRTRELNEANAKLEHLSLTDALTGVANRRAFDEYAAREWRRAVRDRLPFALLMVDVDCFKAYNDFYGHQAGDVCLRNIAGALQSGLRRPSDMVARYGGEEFAVVLPQAEDNIERFADFLRASVEALQIPHYSTLVERKVVTISIGVAYTQFADQGHFVQFMKSADDALYRAKQGGRNRVVSVSAAPEGTGNLQRIADLRKDAKGHS